MLSVSKPPWAKPRTEDSMTSRARNVYLDVPVVLRRIGDEELTPGARSDILMLPSPLGLFLDASLWWGIIITGRWRDLEPR